MPNKTKKTLNFEILKYFLVFSVSLLTILWVLEIVFLNDFYRALRIREIKKASNSIVAIVEDENYNPKEIFNLFMQKNISGVVINNTQETVTTINDINLRTLLGNNFENKLLALKGSLEVVDDEFVLYINHQDKLNSGSMFDSTFSEKSNRFTKGVVYLSKQFNNENNELLIMVFGDITPIQATTSTLREQLLIVTVVMVVISGLLSWLVSRKIAKPIEDLNNDARIMATGNYDINFNGTGYREIEELSDTLNDTAIQLQKADQITKDLIANVSHDLRTPLTMISGYGEVIRDVPGENTPENIQVIIDEADRLTTLVNNLLDISKLQSGAIDVNISTININDLIIRVSNAYSTMMEKNGYKFILDIDNGDCYVRADSIRIEQVFYNLINNAITHIGEDKSVFINCKQNNETLRVEIIDHGQGIAESDIPLIWQRYYKVDKQHTRPETGSGLGLSIVKTILDLHKANYGVESVVGKGTTFWFELPIAESENNL